MTRPAPFSFILASGSAGRLGLLRQAGFEPEVVVSGVDETCDDNLSTAASVVILAERKASAVASQRPGALVLGCDSLLDFEGRPLGKPATPDQAADGWRRIAGQQGTLYTGHCLIDGASGRRISEAAATRVRFGSPTAAELAAYIATGEPLAMAGGFSIDGRGAWFVEGITGDPGNVIGLSLPLLRGMLAELGIAITDLWQ
jgi:nucleoside triphosphate pyrophosphatase